MKKLILTIGLFAALALGSNAVDVTIFQGQGVIYGYTDNVYGYPTWAPDGEIYPVYDPLIWGYIENAGGGWGVVRLDVDTDFPMDFYYAGDLPSGTDELYIELF